MSKNAKKRRKIENVADAKSSGEVGQVANAESLIDETWSKFPNFLITNPKYSGCKLSNDAKILYLLFRSAFAKSVENKQFDTNGKPYFYYGIDKMELMLGKSRKVCTKAKQDLVNIGLVYPDPDSGHFDPRKKANTPKRYYLLVPDYTFSDTLKAKNSKAKSSKALSHMDSPKGNSDNLDDENAKNGDRSPIPTNGKNPKNLNSGSKALSHMDSPKGNSDNLDDENLRSLESTIPLEKNENSKSSKALSHMDSPKGNSDKNENKKAEKPDKSTFLKNENFNEVPSALLPLGQSKNELNKDRYIDYLYNSYSYFNTPINLLTNNLTNTFNHFNYFNSNNNNKVKAVKDIKDNEQNIDNIPDLILNSDCYNVLRKDTLTALAYWLKDYTAVKDYAERISWAVKQSVNKSNADNQQYYNRNKERILYHVSKVVNARIYNINHPSKDLVIENPANYIFAGVRNKVTAILQDHTLLNQPTSYSNKRVEVGTNWSKKKADTKSNVSTAQLKALFAELDKNKKQLVDAKISPSKAFKITSSIITRDKLKNVLDVNFERSRT